MNDENEMSTHDGNAEGLETVEDSATDTVNESASDSNPYQSVIEQQGEQIRVLIEQNKALNEQVVQMLQSGAQFSSANSGNAHSDNVDIVSMQDDPEYSLEALGREIGKPPKHD